MLATVAGWVLAAVVFGPAVAEAQNATGKPNIWGHKVEAERLSVGLGGISDPDGEPFTNINVSWYRVTTSNVQSRIYGANGYWYEPVQADVGKRIKVEVSFRDADNNRETVTSDLTTPIIARPRLTIHDLTVTEPSSGTLDAEVRVSLDRASPARRTIQLNFRYVSGTALAPIDDPNGSQDVEHLYSRGTNILRFLPGETETTISLGINGGSRDGTDDTASEEFYIELFNYQHRWVELANDEATITILNASGQVALDPLGVALRNAPSQHDGSTPFTFDLNFTDDVTISAADMRDHAITVTGGTVTAAAMRDGRADRWEITVEPSGSDQVLITVPPTSSCSDDGALCTSDDVALSQGAFANVLYLEIPLTASFSDVPDEHDGSAVFTFKVSFSEELASGSGRKLQRALSASGGRVTRVRRAAPPARDVFNVRVKPSGSGAVALSLSEQTGCEGNAALCTSDSRALSNSLSDTVAGPVGLSVADTRVDEGTAAVLALVVSLSRAATGAVSVDYATSDGTALASVDYTAATGTLTFQVGDTSKTIEVAVLDDSHNEGEETLTLVLSNASGAQLADAEATGTIANHDALPHALIARFGRSAAVHVVEQVEERIEAPRRVGFQGRFAGRDLRQGTVREAALGLAGQLAGFGMPPAGVHPPGIGLRGPLAGSAARGAASFGAPNLGGPGRSTTGAVGFAPAGAMGDIAGTPGMHGGRSVLQTGMGGESLLTGSAFSLTRETRTGGILSFWSRGARSSFSGQDGALSLGGDVQTTMFGADYAKGPLVAGLSLSNSRGLGEYAGVAGGRVASAVTGLYPWLGYKATDRVTVWGVTGYGAGGMLLSPDEGPALESGLSMAMAAVGTRGELVAGGATGFQLAFKADALWVGTSVDGVDGPGGRLEATEAAVTRFRTGLEGSRDYTVAGRLLLRPSVEVGVRQDGGDAENGAGIDVGGGLIVSDAETGLSIDFRLRMLVVHQAEGFRERGVALSVSYNPRPSTPLGFIAKLAPSWGGEPRGGAQALWGRDSVAGLAHGGFSQGNRLDGEVGYGLPVGNRLVGTPRVGFSTTQYGQDYRLGYTMGVLEASELQLQIGIEAEQRHIPSFLLPNQSDGREQRVLGRATVEW